MSKVIGVEEVHASYPLVFAILFMACEVVNIFLQLYAIKMDYKRYFTNSANYISLFSMSFNVSVSIVALQELELIHGSEVVDSISHFRVLVCPTIFGLALKLTYFISLNNEFAPLFDTILRIVEDTKYFLIIVLICICSFAVSFYAIG